MFSGEEVVRRAGEAEAGAQRGGRGQGHERSHALGVDQDTGSFHTLVVLEKTILLLNIFCHPKN